MQISMVPLRAARELGLKPLLQLGAYRFMHRSGWLRRQTPIFDWTSRPLGVWLKNGYPSEPEAYLARREETARKFFFNNDDSFHDQIRTFHNDETENVRYRAEQILEGFFPLFGDEMYDLGFPPRWNSFPGLGLQEPAPSIDSNHHWTKYEDDDFPRDVKFLWEPSRFGWAFALARAHLLTGEDEFADGFWKLIESWRGENIPNAGPQWISAQEAAFRVLALVFSWYAFFPEFRAKPERITTLLQMIAIHADRILPTLTYSRAQRNNHLILEAVALYSVGLLFPELSLSEQWRELGRRLFIEGISDQVFPDGGYIQHSTNYHRLALQASIWLVRLAELNGEDLPKETISALQKMAHCLGSVLDPISGHAPNFGHNDGAHLLPLTNCSSQDYRPVLQLANVALHGQKPFFSGPWDELLLWFGVSIDSSEPITRVAGGHLKPKSNHRDHQLDRWNMKGKSFPHAGLHVLQGRDSWGLLRCVPFTTRPAHSDQLHFDLWWKGESILLDAGTYLYNNDQPWRNGLASANVHNAPVVDELEPMARVGTFLWLKWSEGQIQLHETSSNGGIEIISGWHDGYLEIGLSVFRTVIRAGDKIWRVVDEIVGKGEHSLRSGWLLPDAEWKYENHVLHVDNDSVAFKIEVDGEGLSASLVRAGKCLLGENSPTDVDVMGWHSPTYGRLDPSLFFISGTSGSLPLRIITSITFGEADPSDLAVQFSSTVERGCSVRSVTFMDECIEI